MIDPCHPCVWRGICEHCHFGYQSPEKNHKLMYDLLADLAAGRESRDLYLAKNYAKLHPSWREEIPSSKEVEKPQDQVQSYHKDRVTNASTGLMAIRDLATFCDIPINIHFADSWIHVIVGFGTPWMQKHSWYAQDLYRVYSESDAIYDWIKKTCDLIRTKINEEKENADN